MVQEASLLLVEDNPDDVELTLRELKRHTDFNVNVAISGEKCLEKLKEKRYDILLLDYMLPGIDGIEVLEKIIESGYDLPVVVVTGRGDEEIATSFLKKGAYDYVVKSPGYLPKLPAVVEDSLEKYGMNKVEAKARVELIKAYEDLKEHCKELKETQAQLVQAHKMTALGTLAAGICHQLNQPLTGIKGFAQCALAEVDKESSLCEDLKTIEEQAKYMEEIITNISRFARQSESESVPLDINKPLEAALGLLSEQLRVHNIRLIKDIDPNLPNVNANFNQMQQVFINFITNAREAMDSMPKDAKKELTITTRAVASKGVKSKDFVEILFIDTGPGIPDKIKDKIFEPFFTTKGPQSTGLGLSLSYGMIQEHGGFIDVTSSEGRGMVFRVALPSLSAKPCWEIARHCSSKTRNICPAYIKKAGHHCWTIGGTICKEKAISEGKSWTEECKKCEIYKRKGLPPRK